MDATTAALLGAAIGFLGNALLTWINKHFDERKARRELIVKTAWDCYSTRLEPAKERAREGGAGRFPLFSVFLFHTIKTVDLALRKNLSNEEIADEMRKIEELASGSLPVSHPPRLSATGDRRTSELAR
jgi:hypothetical protein